MPYFERISRLTHELNLWADMRHGQGAKAKPIMDKLQREMARTLRELKRLEPGATTQKHEPNDYQDILAARPRGPRRLWEKLEKKGLSDRMKGAWLGRAAACTLGAAVEGWDRTRMEGLSIQCGTDFPPTDYWTGHPVPHILRYEMSPFRDYLRGNIRAVPVDDDLAYTVLGLLILEEYGLDFTTEDVGKAWLQYLPLAYSAERVALQNLKDGVSVEETAVKGNPFQEWIGADIRSDPWAYAAPGWPEKAAEYAYRDSYISHRYNGIYGAMYFSAAIAAAFAVDCPVKALEIGLTEIPKNCRLAKDVKWALEVGPTLKDWREGKEEVDERCAGMPRVHTNNNACITIFALIMGQMDFTKTIGWTVAMEYDNDCTAATAGSLLGAIIGAKAIPKHWWKPFHNKALTYLKGKPEFKNTDIVNRFMALAKATWDAG